MRESGRIGPEHRQDQYPPGPPRPDPTGADQPGGSERRHSPPGRQGPGGLPRFMELCRMHGLRPPGQKPTQPKDLPRPSRWSERVASLPMDRILKQALHS